MKNIILCGAKMSGKTTLGKKLAENLRLSFVDTDVIFCKAFGEGQTIGALYKKMGEQEFRRKEMSVLQKSSKDLFGNDSGKRR